MNKSLVSVSTHQCTWSDSFRAWTVEASTIGLAPGDWPDVIELSRDGVGPMEWFIGKPIIHAGELLGYNYVNASTITIKVYND
jgi:hypothetical protein